MALSEKEQSIVDAIEASGNGLAWTDYVESLDGRERPLAHDYMRSLESKRLAHREVSKDAETGRYVVVLKLGARPLDLQRDAANESAS
ncbi:MAG: hypothetical protein GWN00_08650 [Aliifodinibius sp.]|nr:hypothetical protein [Fodinibius sp.]NIY24871.1 hypothetical protein [Fodinibius sp.]